jgi:hypothetical protein
MRIPIRCNNDLSISLSTCVDYVLLRGLFRITALYCSPLHSVVVYPRMGTGDGSHPSRYRYVYIDSNLSSYIG